MTSRGFTLVEMVIAAGLIGALVLGAGSLLLNSVKLEHDAQSSYWLSARQQEIRAFIRSPVGWVQMIADNPAMGCLSIACPGIVGPQPLRIQLDTNTLVDGTLPGTGMRPNGEFCQQFDAVNGHQSCIYGIELRWEALCDPGSPACGHPQPRITARFREKKRNEPLKQLNTYDLVVYRDPKLDSINEICSSMGGTIKGTSVSNYTCDIPKLSLTCDTAAGQYALGFDDKGQIICGKPALGACVPPEVASGFNADGSLICTTTGGSCPLNQNCVGSFGPCSKPCDDGSGPGTQTYVISQPALGTGTACPFSNGATTTCNTQSCTSGLCWELYGATNSSIIIGPAGACTLNGACTTLGVKTQSKCEDAGGILQGYGRLMCVDASTGDCVNSTLKKACDWTAQQTFWGAPHPHNTAKCNNLGSAEVTATCDATSAGQLVQCCDSNISVAAGTGADCVQYRCLCP